MKCNRFSAAVLALLIGAAPPGVANAAGSYDAAYNARRIDAITRDVLNEVNRQRKEFIEAHEAARNSNGNNSGSNGSESKEKAPAPPAKFRADAERIKAVLRKKYPQARMEDITLDLRSAVELEEAVKKEMAREPLFSRSEEEMEAEERRMIEEKYPLYKENERVSITFARGNEKERTYTGSFRRNGRFKFFIGNKTLNYNDLPEDLRARFLPQLNKEKREAELRKHPIINRYRIEWENELAVRVRDRLDAQYEKNLRKGWVYINKAWRVPEDLVEDILTSRETLHRTSHEGPHFQVNPTGIYGGASN